MSLILLPEDSIQNVATYLSGADLMNFLSTHRRFNSLAVSECFWRMLLVSRRRTEDHNAVGGSNSRNCSAVTAGSSFSKAKKAFLVHEYSNYLPSVEWIPLRQGFNYRSSSCPSPREGHMACQMGSKLIVTGGFGENNVIHLVETFHGAVNANNNTNNNWNTLLPQFPESLSYVYGATLTPLDDNHAIRFGGFRAGGYSLETDQVALLTLQYATTNNDDNSNNTNEKQKQQQNAKRSKTAATDNDENNDEKNDENNDKEEEKQLNATWQVVTTFNNPPSSCLSRAYHSATLLFGRYLLVIGGMTSTGSILNEAVLDTQTWTWLDYHHHDRNNFNLPTGRHGHSVVWDSKRNRLVLFGGGNGSDLLRSGFDNAEVWELKTEVERQQQQQQQKPTPEDLVFPWKWNQLFPKKKKNTTSEEDEDKEEEYICSGREDHEQEENGGDEGDDEEKDNEGISRNRKSTTSQSTGLSHVEALTLGRCHIGLKVTMDTVLLLFGSGRPSTNGILAYDLIRDNFFRPQIKGPLPIPRFTAAATLIKDNGYVLVHGGYTSQEHRPLSDPCVLDLAPGLQRPFSLLPVETNRNNVISYDYVAEEQVLQERFYQRNLFQRRSYGGGGQEEEEEGEVEQHFLTSSALQSMIMSLSNSDNRGGIGRARSALHNIILSLANSNDRGGFGMAPGEDQEAEEDGTYASLNDCDDDNSDRNDNNSSNVNDYDENEE